jgi:hypothetical protein
VALDAHLTQSAVFQDGAFRKGKRETETARHGRRAAAGFLPDQACRSKRSASITLTQAETKSQTNFSRLSSWA